MAMGKPVITTNYSAHTEFCNPDNSYLIEIDELEDAHDGKLVFWTKGNGLKLAIIKKNNVWSIYAICNKNRPQNNSGIHTGQNFTWENSVKRIIELIK